MNTIYRLFIFRPKYVIFPPHWSPGSSPAPRNFSFSFPKQNSTTKQLSVCPLSDQTCNFLTHLENEMCNFSYPFLELTKHNCHPRINYHFQTWLLSQQPFSDQNGFTCKTMPIWIAPIYTWSLFSAPPPKKKRAQSKITLICMYSGLHFQILIIICLNDNWIFAYRDKILFICL